MNTDVHILDALAVMAGVMELANDRRVFYNELFPQCEGVLHVRQFIAEDLTPFMDKWFEYCQTNHGYDYPYDLQFVPDMLAALPTLDINTLSASQVITLIEGLDL